MVNADLQLVKAYSAAREFNQLAVYLSGLITKLAKGGAQFASIPAFAPQVCESELNALTPVPLISPVGYRRDSTTTRAPRNCSIRSAIENGNKSLREAHGS
jgi:hypothetical protein